MRGLFDDRFRTDSGFGCEQVRVLRPVLGGGGEVWGVREGYRDLLSFFVVGELGEGVGELVWKRVGDWASVAEEEFVAWVGGGVFKRECEGNAETGLPSTSMACPEAREQSAPVESMKNT